MIFELEAAVNGLKNCTPFILFAFNTLTTLNFGDVNPVKVHARSLSALEAISGQIYLAVLISRLVGLSIAERNVRRD